MAYRNLHNTAVIHQRRYSIHNINVSPRWRVLIAAAIYKYFAENTDISQQFDIRHTKIHSTCMFDESFQQVWLKIHHSIAYMTKTDTEPDIPKNS